MEGPRVPLRNVNVQYTFDARQGGLELHLGEHAMQCNRAEGIVWALCNGRTRIDTLGTLLVKVPGLDIGADPKGFAAMTVDRLQRAGFLEVKPAQVFDYPIHAGGFSHFVTTRGGLYGIHREGYEQLAEGMFFGLHANPEGDLLAFEFPHLESSLWHVPFSKARRADTGEGVVRQFSLCNNELGRPQTRFEGLGNNCHSLALGEHSLFVVDTGSQAVWELDEAGGRRKQALFDASVDHHINSIAVCDSIRIVMKCRASVADNRSGVGVFDTGWNLLTEIELPGQHAHDILLEDADPQWPVFWYCDSVNGRLRHHPSGRSFPVPSPIRLNSITRGLSQTQSGSQFVVGCGRYGQYDTFAGDAPHLGAVLFIERESGTVEHQVPVPEAPCSIIANPGYRPG